MVQAFAQLSAAKRAAERFGDRLLCGQLPTSFGGLHAVRRKR
jgi:hypothetical protein